MYFYEDLGSAVTSRAFDLARTGSFEDFGAIEHELIAEGFGHDIDAAKNPAIQYVAASMCEASHVSNGQFEKG
jgi:hypothetical protein